MRTLILVLTCAGISMAADVADFAVQHGKIVTLDKTKPTAQALAARGGRILAVGSDAEIAKYIGPSTKVIDLHGAMAMPGFIEGHGHFTGVGQFKMTLNLRNARSWDEIVAMVGAAAKEAKPGAWIVGRGWHQAHWDKVPEPNVQGFPVETELSKAAPNNPVLLTHASGHAAMVNAMALKLAHIDRNTPDPEGGAILRDANGNPTGLLNERAQQLGGAAKDRYDATRPAAERMAEARRAVQLAAQEALSKGITTFEDAGSPPETLNLVRSMEPELGIRMWMMLRYVPNDVLAQKIDQYKVIDAADHHFTVRAIKRQIDGALGSRGAWMLEPYSDLPSSTGLNTEPVADIRRTAEIAIDHGFQLCVHAIGDRANREVLNMYESVFREHPDKHDLRWRIEHAQHLNPADIPRFAKLGVIAAMQGIHCTSDAPYVIPRLGAKRAEEGAYVWRSLIDAGATIGNGTDAPVEDVDPIPSFYASVSRRLKDGSVFYPKQRMTREEALRSYTINNAYAAFQEKDKGTLEPGKLADITVLSKDIMTVPEEEIPTAQVLYTIIGGHVEYARNKK